MPPQTLTDPWSVEDFGRMSGELIDDSLIRENGTIIWSAQHNTVLYCTLQRNI